MLVIFVINYLAQLKLLLKFIQLILLFFYEITIAQCHLAHTNFSAITCSTTVIHLLYVWRLPQ